MKAVFCARMVQTNPELLIKNTDLFQDKHDESATNMIRNPLWIIVVHQIFLFITI